MQPFFSLLSWRLFTAHHVSGVLPPNIRSSTTAVAASGFTFVSWWESCCVRGRAGPARPRTQHGYHHDTKVKPEAATAVIELLTTGGRTPETWWAVNKRQDNKLKNCCIWLVIYLNYMMKNDTQSWDVGCDIRRNATRLRFSLHWAFIQTVWYSGMWMGTVSMEAAATSKYTVNHVTKYTSHDKAMVYPIPTWLT